MQAFHSGVQQVSGPRVYIHELIEIIGHNRARYMHHMTANWCPVGRAERDQLCFGVWGTVGSTGRWPEVVNLWEYRSWDALAENFDVEFESSTLQDPSLTEWWAQAAQFRSGGVDRILVAADWAPSIDQLTSAGIRGVGYAHELVRTVPGESAAYIRLLRDHGVEAHRRSGLELVGAFETAMVNDSECVVIWAFPSWKVWAEFEAGQRSAGALVDWRNQVAEVTVDWRRTLMVDAELSPLRIGRQPDESDRRPLDDF